MRERRVESREVLDISRKPCVNMGGHIFAFHESCQIKEKRRRQQQQRAAKTKLIDKNATST